MQCRPRPGVSWYVVRGVVVFRVRKIYSVQAGAVVCFGSFSDLPLCFHAERAKAPQFLALVQSRTTQTAEKRARDCTWHLTSHFTSLHLCCLTCISSQLPETQYSDGSLRSPAQRVPIHQRASIHSNGSKPPAHGREVVKHHSTRTHIAEAFASGLPLTAHHQPLTAVSISQEEASSCVSTPAYC